MIKDRLIRTLTSLTNKDFFDQIDNYDLDGLLGRAELLALPDDQKRQLDQLHRFVLEVYDGELDKKAVLLGLILDSLVALKDRVYFYPLGFWLNQILITDKAYVELLVLCCRAALQAKFHWTIEQDKSFVGTADIPCHFELEARLVELYNWLLTQPYNPANLEDHKALDTRVSVVLAAL